MTIYDKLNEARSRIQSANLTKSGLNKFAGFSYYELSDYLPFINNLAKELKFSCVCLFDKDIGYLKFIDNEKPEDVIIFSVPFSIAELKGANTCQQYGAGITYNTRYLYQTAFAIVESDVAEAVMGEHQKQVVQNNCLNCKQPCHSKGKNQQGCENFKA